MSNSLENKNPLDACNALIADDTTRLGHDLDGLPEEDGVRQWLLLLPLRNFGVRGVPGVSAAATPVVAAVDDVVWLLLDCNVVLLDTFGVVGDNGAPGGGGTATPVVKVALLLLISSFLSSKILDKA